MTTPLDDAKEALRRAHAYMDQLCHGGTLDAAHRLVDDAVRKALEVAAVISDEYCDHIRLLDDTDDLDEQRNAGQRIRSIIASLGLGKEKHDG